MSVFIIFECSHHAVFEMCRLEFCFINLPFPATAGKTVQFSCAREAYSSHFRRFQNMLASCERSLILVCSNAYNDFSDAVLQSLVRFTKQGSQTRSCSLFLCRNLEKRSTEVHTFFRTLYIKIH